MQNDIRIHISQRWSAEAFSQLYTSANVLYLFFCIEDRSPRAIESLLWREKQKEQHLIHEIERAVSEEMDYSFGSFVGRLSSAIRVSEGDISIRALRDVTINDRNREFVYLLADLMNSMTNNIYSIDQTWRYKLKSVLQGRTNSIYRSPQLLKKETINTDTSLIVRRTQHGSPGFTDLTGAAQVVGHVKDFLVHLIDKYSSREERRLKNEMTALEILERKLSIMERVGCDEAVLQQIVADLAPHIEFFNESATRGDITHIDTPAS